jgi:hypothetical protein
MAGGVILQEPLAAMDAHEGGQVVVQNCDIPGSHLGLVFGQKVKANSVPAAAETTPDHNRGRMFDSTISVLLTIAVNHLRPPHH